MSTQLFPQPQQDGQQESAVDTALAAVYVIVAGILLACAPALVIACWRWAL